MRFLNYVSFALPFKLYKKKIVNRIKLYLITIILKIYEYTIFITIIVRKISFPNGMLSFTNLIVIDVLKDFQSHPYGRLNIVNSTSKF